MKRQPQPMSADEFRAYVNSQTKKLSPKKADSMTAKEFRDGHVDQQEHGLQALCVEWFKITYPQLMLAAIPNAAKRSFALAAMLKAEGMITGFPDLILAYPSKGFGALFIEMKTIKGDPSPDQIAVHVYLRSVDYEVIMPRTFEEFQTQVNEYLGRS